jgi:hypothetical protein
MSLLVVCVVILTVLTVLNAALSTAIIRMLRVERDVPLALPSPGHTVGQFSVHAMDGTLIEGNALVDVLAVFVAPTCAPCATLLDAWPDHAAELPADTIAFVIDTATEEDALAYAEKLGPRVRTAVVERGSDVAAAFGVGDVTPTLLRVRDGVVSAVGHSLDRVLSQRERVVG